MLRIRVGALAGVLALVCAAAPARAGTPAAGYSEEVVASGLSQAIGLDFAPDGRIFVAVKSGRLVAIDPGGAVHTVLDLSSHVNTESDRGLTGVAVDPGFAANGYVYLLYTYEGTHANLTGPKTARLTRVTVRPDDTVANPADPETVILGTYQPTTAAEACPAPANTSNCLPADGISHVNDSVRASADGTLYLTLGDSTYSATNLPDPFRTFDPTSPVGKVLHISAATGNGVPGHPFCPSDTTLTDMCTRVLAVGFRNPFRLDVGSGGILVGDVGENVVEEIDRVKPGGSYGWPCYEGPTHYGPQSTDSRCTSRYAKEGTADAETGPIFSYLHDSTAGAAIIGGPRYTGSAYPAPYVKGGLFYGDVDRAFLDVLELDADGTPVGTHRLVDGWLGTDLRVGPDGLLYWPAFDQVRRLASTVGNRPPTAQATATPTAGLAPLKVVLNSAGSSDPDGDALHYEWDFGDGSAHATAAKPSHTYSANGTYVVELTVRDPSGASGSTTVKVIVGDKPPALSVSSPAAGSTYRDGVPVSLVASAKDAEDGTYPGSAIHWNVVLHHNDHFHFFSTLTGRRAQFTPVADHDMNAYYTVEASVTDSAGATVVKRRRIDPEPAPVSVTTSPAAAIGTVDYGGVDRPLPYSAPSAIGYQTAVVAPATIGTSDGKTLLFSQWSDGVTTRHRDVTVPASGLSLVAQFVVDSVPPNTTITSGPPSPTSNKHPTFTFTASEAASGFDCQLDKTGWRPCSSPYTLPDAVAAGNHTFYVRAWDLVRNYDPTPASKAFLEL